MSHESIDCRKYATLQDLKKLRPLRVLISILLQWLIILACFFGATYFQSLLIHAFMFLIIATRQHALIIIMHDAAHGLFFKNKWANEIIGNWLTAYPFFSTVHLFRVEHMQHHAFVNSNKDPYWTWAYAIKSWRFPKSKLQTAGFILLGAFSFGFLKSRWILTKKLPYFMRAMYRQAPLYFVSTLSYFTLFFALIFFYEMGTVFFFFWILPFFTLVNALNWYRLALEHHPIIADQKITRNYPTNLLTQTLLYPCNVHLHGVHHEHPDVPFYNLRKAEKIV